MCYFVHKIDVLGQKSAVLTVHQTLVIDWLMYVQNILQPSFVGPFDVVGPRQFCLQYVCHNAALVPCF